MGNQPVRVERDFLIAVTEDNINRPSVEAGGLDGQVLNNVLHRDQPLAVAR